MASKSHSDYLPPLDACLSGEASLLSWTDAFVALCDLDVINQKALPTTYEATSQSNQSTSLQHFLTHDSSRKILTRPLLPFLNGTPETKKAFEAATAPINVAPSDTSKELVEDSLWLSKEVSIDEISSLRIALIEWHKRPEIQLSNGLTEEEVVGIQDAWKNSTLRGPAIVLSSSIVGSSQNTKSEAQSGFISVEKRRKRLLEIYISESNAVYGIVKVLVQTAISNGFKESTWIDQLSKSVAASQGLNSRSAADTALGDKQIRSSSFITAALPTLSKRLQPLANGCPWETFAEDDQFQVIWFTHEMTEMIIILQLLFVHITAFDGILDAPNVEMWFDFMSECEFFRDFQVPVSQSTISLFQLLISSISLAILNIQGSVPACFELAEAIASEGGDNSYTLSTYLADIHCVRSVHDTLKIAAQRGPSPATPAVLAWSLIAHNLRLQKARLDDAREEISRSIEDSPDGRRFSSSSNQLAPCIFDEFYAITFEESTEDDDIIEYLARASVSSGNVFELIAGFMSLLGSTCGSQADFLIESRVRTSFLRLIGSALGFISYSQEVVVASLAILTKTRLSWEQWEETPLATAEAIAYALKNHHLHRNLFQQALARFPLEITPALKLSRTLMITSGDGEQPEILGELSQMKILTLSIPKSYRNIYQIVEDEHGNPRAKLLDNLQLFKPLNGSQLSWRTRRTTSPGRTTGSTEDMIVPAAVEGYTSGGTDDSITASFEFEYAAVSYLAKLLSTASVSGDSVEAMTGTTPDLSTICEIVAIFTSILRVHVQNDDIEGSACQVLEQARVALGLDSDLISVILDIFEKSLQSNQLRNEGDVAVEFYANCVQFLHVLIHIQPNRVWSFLGRTQFLELHRSNVNLASIILAVETIAGQYDLLISCIKFTNALVENAVTTTVKSEANTKALTRFGFVRSSETVTPAKSKSAVLLALLKVFTGALESIPNWKFNNPADQLEINTSLLRLFDKVLTYTYGYDEPGKESGHLAEVVFPGARYLTEIFLSTSTNEMPIIPTLNLLAFGLKISPSTTHARDFEIGVSQTKAALSFCVTLLRVGILLGHPTSRFEKLLFRLSPIITRLYGRLEAYRPGVLKLLAVMVESGARSAEEPPSLLGHLGTETTKCFLQLLSASPQQSQIFGNATDLWNFLSKVIINRQQWLSIYLLTGKTPKESLKDKSSTSPKDQRKSVLKFALEKLQTLESVPEQEANAILKFVSATQSYVPWALKQHATEHKACKNSMIQFFSNMQWDNKSAVQAEKFHQLSIAATITEILAMDLHNARKRGEPLDVKSLFPHLHILRHHAVEIPAYNSSLHASLQRNLEAKFPGCKLQRFKHTSVAAEPLGSNYCYDIGLASKTLGRDKSWRPDQRDGFRGEFIRANDNLSFVESQIMLLNSWKLLALELSGSIATDEQWAQALVQTAGDCLRANAESQLAEVFLQRLTFVRVDFAFALVQRLVDANCRDPSASSLLLVVWDVILSSVSDFDNVFATQSADYYRALLRVLFLSLQFHLEATPPGDNGEKNGASGKQATRQIVVGIAPTLLEILNKVVSKGFRCLANILHEDVSLCSPADFVLVTAILQKLFLVPSVSTIHSQIAADFAMNDTARYATTLFSWSDRLAVDNHDPLYGELSILFLLELSIITPMAEHLAVEGVLSQLNNAAIMDYLRRPQGTGPFDQPPRIFSIWGRGILPLCINLLYAVGPPIAEEVANFLNQYSGQLERAGQALSSRIAPSVSNPSTGRITLGMASEAHSLALINLLLEQYRIRGSAEGVLAGDVPLLNWDRVGVKEDIEGWIQGRRGLRDRIVPANEKEVELMGAKASDDSSENKLEERIVVELKGALECLNFSVPN